MKDVADTQRIKVFIIIGIDLSGAKHGAISDAPYFPGKSEVRVRYRTHLTASVLK